VAVPNQPCGLTVFDRRLPVCPPDPNSIRSIIFQKNNLSVVSGATTEIDISLLKLFIPVSSAARTNFIIPGKTSHQPLNIYKLDLAGQDLNEEVKFLCLLPHYESGATYSLSIPCGGSTASQITASEREYIEWAFIDEIEVGQLYDSPSIGASSTTSFNVAKINKLEFSWGGYVSATTGSGNMWIATDGGLIKYDGTNMRLWNTLNSNSSSDFIRALDVDASNFVWSGSNFGLSKFTENSGFIENWNTFNSPILSNNVNYVKLFDVNKIAIATDSGLSIFDKDRSWTNFTIYNTPELKQNNISHLATASDYLFLGTTDGVYTFDFTTNIWSSSSFGTGTTGWSAPPSVTALVSQDTKLYVGTTGGLVIIDYLSNTATSIYTGLSGPASDYYKSLRVVNNFLYAGHDDGLSVYNIEDDVWILAIDSGDYPYLASGISDILPDTISGSGIIFMGGETGEAGMARFATGPTAFSLVPEAEKVTNLLISFPLNPTSAADENWQTVLDNLTNIDKSQLYPANQEIYYVFSKNMTGVGGTSSFEEYANISFGLTGSTAVLPGSWSWDSTGRLGTFVLQDPMEKAQGYNLRVINGATATDNSYVKESINVGFYTENIVPILGWKSLGKMLIHTGTENNLTRGLYLRNPQDGGVNVTTLIGR